MKYSAQGMLRLKRRHPAENRDPSVLTNVSACVFAVMFICDSQGINTSVASMLSDNFANYDMVYKTRKPPLPLPFSFCGVWLGYPPAAGLPGRRARRKFYRKLVDTYPD
jgi:hypothetical protein